MTQLTRRGLIPAVIFVPASASLIAARSNVIADVALMLLAAGIIGESLALVTNWRGGTDAVVLRYRNAPNTVVASLRGWSFRVMAIPLLLVGLLFFGASISYMVKGG